MEQGQWELIVRHKNDINTSKLKERETGLNTQHTKKDIYFETRNILCVIRYQEILA